MLSELARLMVAPETENAKSSGTPSERTPGFTDRRRRKLTQVGILSAAPPIQTLNVRHMLCAVAMIGGCTVWAWTKIWPLGDQQWAAAVEAGTLAARPGGPFAEVSLAYLCVLSLVSVSFVLLLLDWMASRAAPVCVLVFECMAMYNVAQCLFNLYCFVMLLREGYRQLQLLEIVFMVLRKQFHGVSFLGLHLRLLNLWAGYVACRSFGGGEAFFPALVHSACQASVYALYFSFSLIAPDGGAGDGNDQSPTASGDAEGISRRCLDTPEGQETRPQRGTRAARVFELHIAQYLVCALHTISAVVLGNFPTIWAVLHLCVIGQGLVLFTDFHSTWPFADQRHSAGFGGRGDDDTPLAEAGRRVTFSFDSCGWLGIYHFGVAAYISENCGLELDPAASLDEYSERFRGVAFSGSSGGATTALILGAGLKVREVFDSMVERYHACGGNPLAMIAESEKFFRELISEGAQQRLRRSVRVLMTRVSWSPPFVMGEVADSSPDRDTEVQVFASCHIPFVAGLLPRRIGQRFYCDGFRWPSLLVPWRGAEGDFVVRVSAWGAPLADLRAPWNTPFWWMILPPPPDVARGLFWLGYRDAACWFATEPAMDRVRLDLSRSWRPLADIAAKGGPSAHARWKAAQALLRGPAAGEAALPEKDPTTGQDVRALIALTESFSKRQGGACAGAAGAVLVGAFLVAAASFL